MNSKYRTKKLIQEIDCLKIIWEDNKTSKFHFLWLRDNCPSAIHPVARMRTFNILTVSKKIHPINTSINKNFLIIKWSEGNHKSKFNLKWLRDHCYTINNKKYKSDYIFWDSKKIKNFKDYKINHDLIIKSDKYLIIWLEILKKYGFAIIKNAPVKKKSGFNILNRISYHRETFFGTPFEVINIPKPNNTAYTSEALRNHTDLPYYEYMPGYQFLHCLINKADGGLSSVVDGFSVANYLKINNRKVYQTLTNTDIRFKDQDYTQKSIRIFYSPLISLDKNKEYKEIRFSMAAMDALDIESSKMKKFYEAYRIFAELIHNKKFVFNFRLEAGDIFCFDNRRVLHGRTSFDPNSGNRHLQGYYIEREEIISRLNYLKIIKK